MIFRGDKLHVAVVKDGHAVITDVTPGHNFGDQIEILTGLSPNDQVIVNPSDSVVSGESANVVQAALPGVSQ